MRSWPPPRTSARADELAALDAAALAWDFSRDAHSGGFGMLADGHLRPPGGDRDGEQADAVRITPGAAWRETLLAPGAMDWLFQLNTAAHSAAIAGERAATAGHHSPAPPPVLPPEPPCR